mmetsp:Transcript_44089/g.84260  ORF Transcript_44089/g.84260 Transcript_44089/m.84260 type:complete len:216 (+) Transcript_44089:296-943(+)
MSQSPRTRYISTKQNTTAFRSSEREDRKHEKRPGRINGVRRIRVSAGMRAATCEMHRIATGSDTCMCWNSTMNESCAASAPTGGRIGCRLSSMRCVSRWEHMATRHPSDACCTDLLGSAQACSARGSTSSTYSFIASAWNSAILLSTPRACSRTCGCASWPSPSITTTINCPVYSRHVAGGDASTSAPIWRSASVRSSGAVLKRPSARSMAAWSP